MFDSPLEERERTVDDLLRQFQRACEMAHGCGATSPGREHVAEMERAILRNEEQSA